MREITLSHEPNGENMTTPQAAPGNVRYTIETSEESRDYIARMAKQYRITQGEVIECLVNTRDLGTLIPNMMKTREEKVAERKVRREQDATLKAALAAMPADKRAALLGETS
jgi:hypothetical protein